MLRALLRAAGQAVDLDEVVFHEHVEVEVVGTGALLVAHAVVVVGQAQVDRIERAIAALARQPLLTEHETRVLRVRVALLAHHLVVQEGLVERVNELTAAAAASLCGAHEAVAVEIWPRVVFVIEEALHANVGAESWRDLVGVGLVAQRILARVLHKNVEAALAYHLVTLASSSHVHAGIELQLESVRKTATRDATQRDRMAARVHARVEAIAVGQRRMKDVLELSGVARMAEKRTAQQHRVQIA